ncbi:hypothetical protein LEP1GSC116_0365, partial [Leptospira interrogans serovar Icterohaemorrhagiae str. Verdun HP]
MQESSLRKIRYNFKINFVPGMKKDEVRKRLKRKELHPSK